MRRTVIKCSVVVAMLLLVPVAAQAQQVGKVWKIGGLYVASANVSGGARVPEPVLKSFFGRVIEGGTARRPGRRSRERTSAVIGFSKGAVAAVYSSNVRFAKLYAPTGVQFAAHIGLYTPCNVRYRDDEQTTGKPIRFHHGIADDYVSIVPCRSYVERLRKAGSDVALAEYPDAYHAYDNAAIAMPVHIAQGQTTRNCLLEEGPNGSVLNAKTGRPYDLATDPCVERGPHIAYNESAHRATVTAVKEFLRAALKVN